MKKVNGVTSARVSGGLPISGGSLLVFPDANSTDGVTLEVDGMHGSAGGLKYRHYEGLVISNR